MFSSQQIVGEDIIVQPPKYSAGESHSLHDVFSYLARGWTSKKIRKKYPEILPETITLARAVLVGRNESHFEGTKKDKTFHDFKVLIDENISPDMAGYLRKHFKKVAHVGDVGLVGKPDEKIWEWAINNSYDVIFTKDKANHTEADLTYAAIQEARSIIRAMDRYERPNMTLSALPLLVHLPGGKNVEKELKRLLRKNKSEFFSYLDNRSTPYIDIHNGSIACGSTYFELRGENQIEDSGLSKNRIDGEKWSSKERIRCALFRHLTVEEIRNMTPERAERIDRFINAAVGMANTKGGFNNLKESDVWRRMPI